MRVAKFCVLKCGAKDAAHSTTYVKGILEDSCVSLSHKQTLTSFHTNKSRTSTISGFIQ